MSLVVKWVLKYDEANTLDITSHAVYHMMPINVMIGKPGFCQIEPITINNVNYLCSYQPEDNDTVMVARFAPGEGFIDMSESDKDNMRDIAKQFLRKKDVIAQ